MNTAFEALMKAMLQHGWFTKSDGDVDSPLGYFGYVTNALSELELIYDAFEDTVDIYGYPSDDDMVGSFFAMIHSSGVIHIVRKTSDEEAKEAFLNHNNEYIEWLGKDIDDEE